MSHILNPKKLLSMTAGVFLTLSILTSATAKADGYISCRMTEPLVEMDYNIDKGILKVTTLEEKVTVKAYLIHENNNIIRILPKGEPADGGVFVALNEKGNDGMSDEMMEFTLYAGYRIGGCNSVDK